MIERFAYKEHITITNKTVSFYCTQNFTQSKNQANIKRCMSHFQNIFKNVNPDFFFFFTSNLCHLHFTCSLLFFCQPVSFAFGQRTWSDKLISDLSQGSRGRQNYRWALQSDKSVPWATEENREELPGKWLTELLCCFSANTRIKPPKSCLPNKNY